MFVAKNLLYGVILWGYVRAATVSIASLTVTSIITDPRCPVPECPPARLCRKRRDSHAMSNNVFAPGPTPGTVCNRDGTVRPVPEGWALLLPGDATFTKRVKAAGDFWVVQVFHRGRTYPRGVWAPSETVERIRKELEEERASEGYAKRKAASGRRRNKIQADYVEDFTAAVLNFLAFHPKYDELAQRLAKAVAEHATPIGSGTVARTKLIPVEERAEAAVIAWMRHQTTAYDSMVLPRAKGIRRETRRMLAQVSRELLEGYRRGDKKTARCPLQLALK